MAIIIEFLFEVIFEVVLAGMARLWKGIRNQSISLLDTYEALRFLRILNQKNCRYASDSEP